MARILITTAPFGEQIRLPIDLLDQLGIEYLINPYGEKLNENQLMNPLVEKLVQLNLHRNLVK